MQRARCENIYAFKLHSIVLQPPTAQMHAFLHLFANSVHLTYRMLIVEANCDDCIAAVGFEIEFFVLHVSAFAAYSIKVKLKVKVILAQATNAHT